MTKLKANSPEYRPPDIADKITPIERGIGLLPQWLVDTVRAEADRHLKTPIPTRYSVWFAQFPLHYLPL